MGSVPSDAVQELVAASQAAVDAPAYMREEALFELDKALETFKFASLRHKANQYDADQAVGH